MDDSGDRAAAAPIELQRVRKAYEQVSDQLRDLIVRGELKPGHRLPNEAALSTEMGVSRATIREALRVLMAESLIRTTKGKTGGSFVVLPTADNISAFLGSNISLLSQAQRVSLDEFLELREMLEVPAARLAAQRRSAGDIEALELAIPDDTTGVGIEDQFAQNRDFHSAVVETSGNTLLLIAAQPVFSVLQTHLQRSNLRQKFLDQVVADHRAIAAAIAAGDADAAASEMHSHLEFLRPAYQRAWRDSGLRRQAES
jgi:GntR family transcriptional regulator, transcriptional repressor for pyruvate dehydrogenase complex